ncbi:MAG: ATP-binding protein [Chloroflexales bacterium]|nr:ATP-binding protein [Chloroflexales bacterium]
MTQLISGVDEQGDSTNQVMSLLKVSSYLVSVLDPDELVTNIISHLVEELPSVQGGMLWLYDRRVSRLRMVSIYGLPINSETCEALKSQSFSMGEGLAGQALQNGEPQLTEVCAGYRSSIGRISPSNQAVFQEIDKQLPPVLTDVCIPLRIGNETSGVIELLNLGKDSVRDQWQPLRSTDMPVLQTFSNLAATAIKNAQLYSQTQNHRQRLDAFDAVVTAISAATDLHDLVRSVLDVVMGLVPCLAGSILLFDPSQDRLYLGTQQGLSLDYADSLHSMPVAGAACEEVVHYGQPTLRPLLEERGESALLAAGMASCAYLPLLAGGTVVGVMGLYGDATLYRMVDTATLMPLSNQVGFAIANVRLYDDSQLERRKLNTVINSIAEGVVLCDSQGRLVLANEAAMNMLTLEYVPYDQPLSEMPDFYGIRDLEGQPLPVEQLPLALALSGEVFHDYRVLLRGASGYDSVMSFSGSPAYAYDDDNSIEGAVVVFRDVTAHQKLERAKDEFLAIAAHELRSPLAAVRSYADLLLRREQQRSEVDPREIQGLTILTQQVSHMLQMVDNLLDVSRIDAGQLDLQIQPVNLVQLVTQVLDQQQPSTANHELVLETDYAELWIRCDSLRIHQVLTNLVSNAAKYSPPDTCITVRLSIRPQDETLTSHEYHAPDNGVPSEVVIEVMDRGSGISKDQLTQLFRRYYRGKNRRAEGLGLGLYLSRQFVLMHGGKIRVESNEDQGSTFAFTLPFDPPLSQCEL